MKVGIVGGGLTGLTAAYRLSQNGHQVTLWEKEKQLGGLAASFKQKGWSWPLEFFFHHLFTTDSVARSLIQELELANQLFYQRPKTAIFLKGQIAQFDSPLSLFQFPHLSLFGKLRTGLATGYLKLTRNWRELEKIPAQSWLKKHYGQRAYQLLWQPLLQAKFGHQIDKVSMAWFWARIKKRSAQLGYLRGGFQVLIDRLAKEIRAKQGRILLNTECRIVSRQFDQLLFTVPSAAFVKIMGQQLPTAYRRRLQGIKMVGALNLVLELKEKFLADGTYWLNINEKGFPFVAVVEHTNFVNPKHYGGRRLLYVGGYYPQNHRYFKMTKETVFKEFLPYLQKINPDLDPLRYTLNASLNAQPIMPLNYSKIIPQIRTPLKNVFLANMQMVYPWDRGVNYAIELGERAAHEILKKS